MDHVTKIIGKALNLTLILATFVLLTQTAQAKILFKNEFLIEDNGTNAFILDSGNDVTGNITLQFGGSLAETISYNPTASWFEFSNDINLNQNQIKNVVVDNQTTAPSSPLPGQIYYNSVDGSTYIWNGTAWEDITENDNFETVYTRDADKTLTTSNGAFTLSTGSGTTNINIGSATGQVNLGGGSNCVNVNSNTWDISCAGLAQGFTGLTSSGAINFISASSFSIPQAASDPATCTIGQQYYNTTSNTVRLCIATNTWSGIAPSGNAYIFAYDTNTQTVLAPGTFQDITYATNAQMEGWTHTPGTANFTASSDGTYMINMTARIAKSGGANTTLSVRGVKNTIAVPGTFTEVAGSQSYGTAAGSSGDTLTGNFIVPMLAGETLKIQMTGGTTGAQIIPGGNGTTRPSAQVSIWRMK